MDAHLLLERFYLLLISSLIVRCFLFQLRSELIFLLLVFDRYLLSLFHRFHELLFEEVFLRQDFGVEVVDVLNLIDELSFILLLDLEEVLDVGLHVFLHLFEGVVALLVLLLVGVEFALKLVTLLIILQLLRLYPLLKELLLLQNRL